MTKPREAERQAATKGAAGRISTRRDGTAEGVVAAHETQVEAVMAAARRSGLL